MSVGLLYVNEEIHVLLVQFLDLRHIMKVPVFISFVAL